MKKRWLFALFVGATAIITSVALASKRGKDKREKYHADLYPEFCGFCDDETCKGCGYDMDNPSILRNRTRV